MYIAPESAYWDEFKKDGGFRISKGAKNIPSQCDILTFDPNGTSTTTVRSLRRSMSAGGNSKNNNSYIIAPPTTAATVVPAIQRSPYQPLFSQEEKVLAGSPSKTTSNIPFFTDFRTRKILSHQSMHHTSNDNNNNNNGTSNSSNTGKPYDVESSVPTTHLIFSKAANCLVHGDPSQARTVRKHGYNNQATIHRNPIIG